MDSYESLRKAQAFFDVLRKPDIVAHMPYYILVGPTTVCPLNCIMCSRDTQVTRTNQLSLADYKKLIDTIHPRKVALGDLGETLYHPELGEFIRYTKDIGGAISVVTSYVISRISREDLIHSGLDLLKISIDAATPETYEKIRGQPYFSRVISNVRELIQARKQSGSKTPYVRLQFVIQQHNYTEIVAYVKFAHEMGVDAINYKPVLLDRNLENRALLVGNMPLSETTSYLIETDRLARKLGIRTNALELTRGILVGYWKIYEGKETSPKELKRCILPWYSTYITSDGNVYGCCNLRFHGDGLLGNIFEADFASIWNSAQYQSFRRKLRSGQAPFRGCLACYPQSLTELAAYLRILPGFA